MELSPGAGRCKSVAWGKRFALEQVVKLLSPDKSIYLFSPPPESLRPVCTLCRTFHGGASENVPDVPRVRLSYVCLQQCPLWWGERLIVQRAARTLWDGGRSRAVGASSWCTRLVRRRVASGRVWSLCRLEGAFDARCLENAEQRSQEKNAFQHTMNAFTCGVLFPPTYSTHFTILACTGEEKWCHNPTLTLLWLLTCR